MISKRLFGMGAVAVIMFIITLLAIYVKFVQP